MNQSQSDTETTPDQALLLRTRDLMGQAEQLATPGGVVELTSRLESAADFEVIPAHREALSENVYESDQLVFRFNADCVGKTEGKLVLVLEVVDPPRMALDPQIAVHNFTVRSVKLQSANGRIRAMLAVLPDVKFKSRWAYSRHARMRLVCEPAFDKSDTITRKWTYHMTFLQRQACPLNIESTTAEYKEIAVELTPREIREIEMIDRCEAILDDLNNSFAVADEYLHWSADRVTEQSLGAAVESLGDRAINVMFQSAEQEWTCGKRVRPIIQFPVILVRKQLSDVCASIGISTT